MSSTITSSLLNLQSHLHCDICHNLLNEPYTITECGHSFCRWCVYDKVGIERKCPTCQEPALVKNLRPAPIYDTLVACVRKLGTLLAGNTPTIDSQALLFNSIPSTSFTAGGESSTRQKNHQEELSINNNQHSIESSMLRLMARISNNESRTKSILSETGSQNDDEGKGKEPCDHHLATELTLSRSRKPMTEKDTNVHTPIPSISLHQKMKRSSDDLTAAAMTDKFSITNQPQPQPHHHHVVEEKEKDSQDEPSIAMQLTQQQDEMTSLSRSLSDEISLPSWMNEMLDRSPTGSNDYNHLIFDTPLLQENTSNKNETPEKTPEMLRDWFLSRTNSDQSRITNSSPTRHILSSTTTMDLGHHSPSHSKTQEQITSSNDRHEHLDSWTDKKNNLNEQVYPHPHDNENQVEPLKYNPSLDPNVNIITQQQQKQNDTSSHKRSSTIEQLEISKPSQSNNNDSKRDKDSNDTEALLDDLLHGALPDDEQPLSKRRKTTPPLRIQPMNEKTSDQLLFECLDQEDGFPDDELHSSAKKREKDSNKGKNRATTTTTNENNKSELTSEDLFSLLDSTLPDDEIPIERTKKQKQQQKKLDSDTCEMKDKDRKQIQEHQEKSKNGLIDTTSVVDDNMMLTMESNNVNDDNNDNEEEDMVMTFPIDDTTTNNNNNGNEHDDSDSYDDDMIETLPVNVIAIETNNNHDDDDDDEDMIMTLPTSNVTACNNNNEDDNEDRASTLDNSIEMSIIHDNSTTTNGLDVFDIDTSFPHCKRLKNIHPSDTHSISSLSSVELSPIISVASIKEQQQKETEPWECMHCFFKNTQSLEKCTFCRNLRDTEPEHTVQQSMVPSTPFMEDETLSLMNNSVIPSSQLEQDQLADTGGSLLYYKEEEEEEEEHISKKSIQVMFTGIEIEQAEILFTQLMDIGLTMQVNNTGTDDIPRHLEEGVTHIITKRKEKDKNLCKRTLKYLWGILAGVWIVDVSWLEDCIRQKRWLSEEHYEIAGDITTGFTFAPRKGRLKRVNQVHNIKSKHDNSWLLFHGIVFYFFDKKHPQRENLVRLCLLAGGDVKHRRPKGGWRDNDDIERCIINPNHPIIIVTDKKQLKNKKNANILESYQVRDSKWLLNCISRNELLTQ